VADKNENDLLILKRAFVEARVALPLHTVTDGQAVLDFLKSNSSRQPLLHPAATLVMMAPKLPKVTSFEVLQQLRFHPVLYRVPVIIWSSSDNPRTIDEAYRLGANSYIRKPQDYDELVRCLLRIGEYWLRYNETATGAPEELAERP
jgi:CheY-like chemotaxis protein